jgi:hypothetical protein
MPEAAQRPPETSGRTLRWAALLLTGEAVLLVALVVYLVIQDIVGAPSTVGQAVAVTLYPAIFAAVLGLLAWSLARRRAWARGPAIVLQMLLIPLGYAMTTGNAALLGVPVMIVGVTGAALLLAPATREALGLTR